MKLPKPDTRLPKDAKLNPDSLTHRHISPSPGLGDSFITPSLHWDECHSPEGEGLGAALPKAPGLPWHSPACFVPLGQIMPGQVCALGKCSERSECSSQTRSKRVRSIVPLNGAEYVNGLRGVK